MDKPPRQDLVARACKFSVKLLALTDDLQRRTRLSRRFIENLAAAGTAIGNNLAEAQCSLSRRQMAACYRLSLREARETKHALEVVRDGHHAAPEDVKWLLSEVDEFVAMVYVSVSRLDEPPDNRSSG